jgi:hypothetical protein
MRLDRTIGGHYAQTPWRLDEVRMVSRIEKTKMKREHKWKDQENIWTIG